MQRSSYRVVSYKVKHSHNVGDFLSSYRRLLQRAIDIIWENIEWRRKGKRLIPLIPKSKEFKRSLRNELLANWDYAAHYVDSAIRTAYSILNSWKRNYPNGCETDDMSPMNPEGTEVDVHQGGCMSLKDYIR